MATCTPLTGEELQNKILEMRLEWGDIDEFEMLLQDEQYAILINKYHCSGDAALSRNVGMTLLSRLAFSSVRERVGQEERYGQDAFNNYFKLLEKKLKDPAFGMLTPIAYFGGTYRDVSEYYTTSNEFNWQPFYRGSNTGQPMWRGKRIFKANGQIIEPYEHDNNETGGVVDHYIPLNEIENMNQP